MNCIRVLFVAAAFCLPVGNCLGQAATGSIDQIEQEVDGTPGAMYELSGSEIRVYCIFSCAAGAVAEDFVGIIEILDGPGGNVLASGGGFDTFQANNGGQFGGFASYLIPDPYLDAYYVRIGLSSSVTGVLDFDDSKNFFVNDR
jgi:hypothetical protein